MKGKQGEELEAAKLFGVKDMANNLLGYDVQEHTAAICVVNMVWEPLASQPLPLIECWLFTSLQHSVQARSAIILLQCICVYTACVYADAYY